MKEKIKIYTGGGDHGMTSLVGGVRVSKTHPRLEAYGTIDELNSFIGLLLVEIDGTRMATLLQTLQQDLFTLSAYLATDTEKTTLKPNSLITAEHIRTLEQSIDALDGELPALREFILPQGCRSAALAHVSRTVCRRAERAIYRLNESFPVDESVLIYINRLSDLLFVIARYELFINRIDQKTWSKV
ncbi:MAG: cob(I)yrinic acid a,c-diamide adenosyltransferase [Tannerella sp.]|jgi:cob(I)alamin adenosyltransferase|nr:cob(I)yrinic acid a,c-diamide adenosyltransferase [Tannerella sp.]